MSSNLPSTPSDVDVEDFLLASTPTPQSHLHRSFANTSQSSNPDGSQQHHHALSQSAMSTSSTPSARSPPPPLTRSSSFQSRRGRRSTSISSNPPIARSREDILSEEDEDAREDGGDGDDGEDDDNPSLKRLGKAAAVGEVDVEDGEAIGDVDDDPITVKDRQSLINVQHPFGLPIWKPALYKKTRSVTRNADKALHSVPSAQAERHLLPGNIFWTLAFGWWLALVCILVSTVLYFIPQGGNRYSTLVYGLGWYLFWPFGKYVEGDLDIIERDTNEENGLDHDPSGTDGNNTIRGASPQHPLADQNHNTSSSHVKGVPLEQQPTITSDTYKPTQPASRVPSTGEATTSLLSVTTTPLKCYGTHPRPDSVLSTGEVQNVGNDLLGKMCFWLTVTLIIAPLMLIVCLISWALVVTIPMAKLNWALLKHIFQHPTSIRFCAAPPVVMPSAIEGGAVHAGEVPIDEEAVAGTQLSFKPPRLAPGQTPPSGSPTSTVLLCVYRAAGLQYYKYTVGGVNILFVNLLPIVFFVIFDGMVLLKIAEKLEHEGKHVPALLAALTSRELIFILSLLSVIPLSYFIGMAVASISAQSSIGMGAVINATFGSIIEILLYSIALTQNKGRLVEGSIVGSLLAGVLLMPGMSMCSSALRRKEQRFNARSASVTSMMLIMAIIGALAPTLFYQTYGNFQLVCTGCPEGPGKDPYICEHCYYRHPDPATDPFYQTTVKSLMYLCAAILLFSYLIGLWFSLRTHASQIWQNPQPLLHHLDIPAHNRMSLYQRFLPSGHPQSISVHRPTSPSLRRKPSNIHSQIPTTLPNEQNRSDSQLTVTETSALLDHARPISPNPRRVSYAPISAQQQPYSPVLETVHRTVNRTVKDTGQVPQTMTTDDFTRAVAVATVSALQHQQAHAHSVARRQGGDDGAGGHGHDGPSWSRLTSASVLLGCTALYAIIAELLVDVVDVMLVNLGIAEKFLGVTLFALVPNTTEFMNAMSFALNGNIALSMEIGSAYALQVCLLQIPAMVAFSVWYSPGDVGKVASSFTLIFPRWDVISLVLSMFLMTYTYIEAKSNYHRGSILIMSYLVLIAGFYYAPESATDVDQGEELKHFAVHTSQSIWTALQMSFRPLW